MMLNRATQVKAFDTVSSPPVATYVLNAARVTNTGTEKPNPIVNDLYNPDNTNAETCNTHLAHTVQVKTSRQSLWLPPGRA